MLQVVYVVSVAVSTQVEVCTLSTAEENPSDASLLASVTNYVLMTNADLSVVDDDEVVLTLIADTIVRPMSRVPIHDDRLFRRMR